MRLIAVILVTAASLGLAGCGPRRVRADFTAYENSYAVTSNREELLNLVRLEQHDPTYFFKLGQISSSYRMEAALTGTGSVSTVNTPPATTVPTGSGVPTFLYENDPSFTLIPVNDDVNANILLRPVSAEVFYSLYLQGWRLDQLFRLTVSRIELTVPTATGCKVEVIRNLPPPNFDAPSYASDGFTLASYITFLRVSAVIYALQKHGLLLLRGVNTFEPLDHASYIPVPDKKGNEAKTDAGNQNTGAGGGTPAAGDDPSSKGTSPTPVAKDFDDAAAKGQVWELGQLPSDANTAVASKGQAWYLGANSIEPQFQLTSNSGQNGAVAGWSLETQGKFGQNVQEIEQELISDFNQPENGMQELLGTSGGESADLKEILEIIYNGFSIEESSADQDSEKNICSGKQTNRITAHLVMRSLIGLMAAAAQEQDSFDKLEQTDPSFPPELQRLVGEFFAAAHLAATGQPPNQDEINNEMKLVRMPATFSTLVPKIEQLPVLKMTWTDNEMAAAQHSRAELGELGLAVHYKGENYLVTDPKLGSSPGGPFISQNLYWNRDMFRLINELSSQVSVDISKFPLPEVLQLRTE
jgi:hypothetical protein